MNMALTTTTSQWWEDGKDKVDWSQIPYEVYMIIMAHHCKNEKDHWGRISFKQPKYIKSAIGVLSRGRETNYHHQPIPRLRLFSCPKYSSPLPSYSRGHLCLTTDKEMKDPRYIDFYKLIRERQLQIKTNPELGIYYKARYLKKDMVEQLLRVCWLLKDHDKAPNYVRPELYYSQRDPETGEFISFGDDRLGDWTMYSNCPRTNNYLDKYKRYAIHPKHMKYQYLFNEFPKCELVYVTRLKDVWTGETYFKLTYNSYQGYLHIGRDKNFETKKGYCWRQTHYKETFNILISKPTKKQIDKWCKGKLHLYFSFTNSYS